MFVRSSRSKAGMVDAALADGGSTDDDDDDEEEEDADADADEDAGSVGGAAVGSSSRMIVSLPPRSREAEEPISQSVARAAATGPIPKPGANSRRVELQAALLAKNTRATDEANREVRSPLSG